MGETTSDAEICISLLGGFSVAVAGKPVEDHWRLRKAKTLVKLLALAPGHWLHRAIVEDILWPDTQPQAAANNLHQILHSVRRMLGRASITLHDDVIRLCPGGRLNVDVDAFEQASAKAHRSNELTDLEEAFALWTGPLLPEDQYADWAEDHRDRLTETHAAIVALLGSKRAELGEQEAALALLEPVAATRPLDEHLQVC
jgi:DNA-binding SARP family transcriptional activator